MVIHHLGLKVAASKYAEVLAWYEAALAPLGYKIDFHGPKGDVVGFRDGDGNLDWWVYSVDVDEVNIKIHLAFEGFDEESVKEFYKEAIKAGGTDNGGPGLRAPNFYAAFVLDPVGNNIEVVYTGPSSSGSKRG
ncbi:hypothetical protein B0T17DRAFT_545200 [Bombardia bombarda]|uniref:Glyoxalase/fosfomycin resistance/dioxygenase domain-containing protein n=1 Tax=Bombardia bombarda TaxID=252184 RepID=A0AA39W9W0_9PEZI|nr:hypothetical protein B0T17DRAFT_545200 [Bombardia bombarda]